MTLFARRKLSFFLPQDEKFILKNDEQTSLLFHTKNPTDKIVAFKISNHLYLCQILLCFKNDEFRKQFEEACPANICIDNSPCNRHTILADLELHQDVSSMETNYISIFEYEVSTARKILIEALTYINAFDLMNMTMIEKINEKFFNYKNLPLLLNKNIKSRLTTAYNKGTMSAFFQKIGLHADVGALMGEYLNEEEGKNLALVAKDIAVMGTKAHNEEADKISLSLGR